MNSMHQKVFLAVADELDYSAAAAALFLPRQSLQKYVHSLEKELGVRLFSRGNGKLTLTEAGRAYYSFLSEHVQRIEETKAAASTLQVQRLSQLSVGIFCWLDPFGRIGQSLKAFQKTHPEIRLRIQVYGNDHLMREFLDENLDVVISPGEHFIYDPDMKYEVIATEDMCLYVPDRITDETIDPNCWGLPLIQRRSWDWSFLEWQYIGREIEKRLPFHPKTVLLLNTETMTNRLRMGDCVALADNNFGVLRDIPGTRLIHLDLNSHISCLWKGINDTALLQEFVRHLKRDLSE